MIRLRETGVRWLRHPLVGPVLIVCLAVALAFLALHEAGEGSVESFVAACATVAALAVVGFLLLRAVSRVGVGPVLLAVDASGHVPPPQEPVLDRGSPLRL